MIMDLAPFQVIVIIIINMLWIFYLIAIAIAVAVVQPKATKATRCEP